MRDLNFFEPYIEKRSFKLNKSLVLYALLMILLLGIAAYGVYNQLTIKALRTDIKSRKEVAENPKTLERVNEIKALEVEVMNFREEVEKIKQLDNTIEDAAIIDDELLRNIKNKMPEDVFLTNFSAYDREIQINGISKDKYSIAEFGNGLTSIADADEVFISNINQVEDYYKFALSVTLKDVVDDGKDQE